MPKETGIIMSGSHPKLILDGLKTQTRRTWGLEFINLNPDSYKFLRMESDLAVFQQIGFTMTEIEPTHRRSYPVAAAEKGDNILFYIKCPYGQVGDRLWVRETYWQDQSGGIWCYKAGGLGKGLQGSLEPEFPPTNCGGKLISSLFMPRWASRITLEITEVRVERLQKISEEDIKAEGYKPFIHIDSAGDAQELSDGLIWFSVLWDSLNAKRGYSWEVNPWVWPIRFKLVDSR